MKIKEFEDNLYCDMSGKQSEAIAGKDLLLCVFDKTGESLLAVSGQNELEINREREVITINSKTIEDGWESNIGGIKKWDMSVTGVYSYTKKSHNVLEYAWNNDDEVCIKIINNRTKEAVYGGLAIMGNYNIAASSGDSTTYDIKFNGCGKLVYLVEMQEEAPAVPKKPGAELVKKGKKSE